PLLGWLTLSAEGTAISFFGVPVPALIGVNEPFAERTEELHETLATAGYFLIGAHALAALFHHYVQRDNTLRRMSFRERSPRSTPLRLGTLQACDRCSTAQSLSCVLRSNARRSHAPTFEAASYVLSRKSSSAESGDGSVRMSSYGSTKSLSVSS